MCPLGAIVLEVPSGKIVMNFPTIKNSNTFYIFSDNSYGNAKSCYESFQWQGKLSLQDYLKYHVYKILRKFVIHEFNSLILHGDQQLK